MKKYPSHSGNLVSLRRIEGQVRGVQRMIENGEYCVDILIQIRAVISALARIEDKILEKHFQMCLNKAVHGGSEREKNQKLAEILQLIRQFRKL